MTDQLAATDAPSAPIDTMLRLTTGADYWTTSAAPELGLRSMRMADGPHGLRVQDDENPDHLGLERSLPATCFPPAVTLASSWDSNLIEKIGRSLALEAKAAGIDIVLGPGLNIKRSPLCGRNFEYYSEDPLLTGVLAGAIARGLQAEGVAACLKHFAVNNQETDRLRVSADVDERALREIYLRAFELAFDVSNAWSVMTSYNRINGTYASENSWLLETVLRDEWGFDGVVISDWGAVTDPVASLQAGLDLRMPGRPTDMRPASAAIEGKLDPTLARRVAERLQRLSERTLPSEAVGAIDYDAHHQLVRDAATQSAVLLTNDGTLPLTLSGGLKVAVIGELARKPRYQGAGSSRVNPVKVTSGLDALCERAEAAGASVTFAAGYHLSANIADQRARISEAVNIAHKADVVILFVGLPDECEVEGTDRETIDLPGNQLALLNALKDTAAKTVVAMSNGSVVTTAEWRGSVNAIVEFWLTGQAHGEAVADILLGSVNPSGKLTETIPLRLQDTPAYLNFPGEDQHVLYGESIYVGYRSYDARQIEVDFPFGHGLSYTRFTYSDLTIEPRQASDKIAFVARLTVKNVGERSGAEIVQLYVDDHSGLVITPPLELRGWSKVTLDTGQSSMVEIAVLRKHLAHWSTELSGWSYTGGPITVHAGSSSRDLRLSAAAVIEGEPVVKPLTLWSTFGEWLDHPVLGPRLKGIFAERGGLKGRINDLLSDEAGQGSVRSSPLMAIAEFPGVPLQPEDLAMLSVEATALIAK